MSYTLRGRIESRLAAMAPVVLLALGLHRWWAIELVALMLAIGATLDLAVYHRALPYQPAWLAVPLGGLELALVYVGMRALEIPAPLDAALLLYGVGWLTAQVLGHGRVPAPAARVRRGRRRARPRRGSSLRSRSPQRSSAGSAPPMPFARRPSISTASFRARS